MAHIGEELAFGLLGGHGGIARFAQFGVRSRKTPRGGPKLPQRQRHQQQHHQREGRAEDDEPVVAARHHVRDINIDFDNPMIDIAHNNRRVDLGIVVRSVEFRPSIFDLDRGLPGVQNSKCLGVMGIKIGVDRRGSGGVQAVGKIGHPPIGRKKLEAEHIGEVLCLAHGLHLRIGGFAGFQKSVEIRHRFDEVRRPHPRVGLDLAVDHALRHALRQQQACAQHHQRQHGKYQDRYRGCLNIRHAPSDKFGEAGVNLAQTSQKSVNDLLLLARATLQPALARPC